MKMALLIAFVLILQRSPAQQQQPIKLSSGVMFGQLIHKVMPQYPREAWEAHVSGSVVLHVIIGEDGHVHDITVVSGPQMLRKAYVDAVSQWVYKPYLLNGKPVPVDTTITMSIQHGALEPPDRIYLSSGEAAGRILTKNQPVFPPQAANGQHESGAIVLHAIIAKDGTMKDLSVVAGPEFERQTVLDAVRQWTYKPYFVNGQPMEVETTITLNIDFGG
jgi:TonB family protein